MVEPLVMINVSLKGANDLLHATHHYIKWQAPLDIQDMNNKKVFKVSSEALRVTVRMTQIIAWLMLQKAVLADEISRKDVLSEDYRVLRGKACRESTSETDPELPPRLRELLKESRALYERILRLDKLARRKPILARNIQKNPFVVFNNLKNYGLKHK